MCAQKKALLGTGRPLTIACHMKKTYFFVESVIFLLVSVIFFEVSVILDDESVILDEVSFAFAEESVLDELPLPLQAANAPIANTNRNFFILFIFVC
jgi:hypothetical protein